MSNSAAKTAAIIACLAVLGLLWLGVADLSAKATEADLAKVRNGMDRAEVLDIMGKPDKDQQVTDEEDLCRLYVYKNVGRYKLVNIWFDCSDKVQAIDKV